MTLKELLGSDYKEGMTPEEISAALANRSFVDPATLGETVSKATFDKTASDLAKAKKDFADYKAAHMTDEQKREQLMRDLEAEKRSFIIKSNRLDVEKELVGAGLSEAEYAPFIDGIVTEDAAASVTLAKSIAKVLSDKSAAAAAQAKKEQINNTPAPKDGKVPAAGMTLDAFRKLDASARYKFAVEHPDEYQALYENNGG